MSTPESLRVRLVRLTKRPSTSKVFLSVKGRKGLLLYDFQDRRYTPLLLWSCLSLSPGVVEGKGTVPSVGSVGRVSVPRDNPETRHEFMCSKKKKRTENIADATRSLVSLYCIFVSFVWFKNGQRSVSFCENLQTSYEGYN